MGWVLLFVLITLLVGGGAILGRTDSRRRWVTAPLFRRFKQILPPLSRSEQEAMAAGTVWWDGELFSGHPDWPSLLAYPKPGLTAEEQRFIDDKVSRLLDMVSDFECITGHKDLPPEVWDYLRQEGFFALIIPKEFGGLGFSNLANSAIVARIASRSLSAAVTVMVPNSLGPAELLLHYGTEGQKTHWLPKLASGEAIPCFALTGLEAGSDASAIPDTGIVCRGQWQGEDIIGIRLNWDKRYITLAPCATVLGLAFKLHDPEQLMGGQTDYGITCALIPTDLPGVEIGMRHYPMGQAFLNGPTRGKDVFIPLDGIIGGWSYAGKGWGMLVESLSAGRGVSLPALGTACGHLATLTTSAYATIRRQFGLSIGRFEGVQEALARIAGLTYQLEAARRLTCTGLDMGQRPGIITAIAKYHMTEMARQVLNDAMDVHAGRGVQWGPRNYLAYHYTGIPIAITVEGANILTRNLMIFGQGATRCHPFVLAELAAGAEADEWEAIKQFDGLLLRHMAFTGRNLLAGLGSGLTLGRFETSPVSGPTAGYYRQLTRMSRALALCTDVAMLTLGGGLKRREMLSARLGDVLSQLYMASATLKMFEDEGRPAAELPLVHYGLQRALEHIGRALQGVFDNLPSRPLGWLLARLIFPLGMPFRGPRDKVLQQICRDVMQFGTVRERLTQLCYWRPESSDAVGQVELAFREVVATQALLDRVQQAQKTGQLPAGSLAALIGQAEGEAILTHEEADRLRQAERLRTEALQVDDFAVGELENLGR